MLIKKWLNANNRNKKYVLITKKQYKQSKKHLVQKSISSVFQNVLVKPKPLSKILRKAKPDYTKNSGNHNKKSKRKQFKKRKPKKYKDMANQLKASNYV